MATIKIKILMNIITQKNYYPPQSEGGFARKCFSATLFRLLLGFLFINKIIIIICGLRLTAPTIIIIIIFIYPIRALPDSNWDLPD